MKPILDKLNRPSFINKQHKGIVFICVDPLNLDIPIEKRTTYSYYIAYKDGKRLGTLDGDYQNSQFVEIK